jgi:STIP1 homology and U-box containing protein 1
VDNITFAIMQDPVMTRTGRSYERSALVEHLSRSATDPITREPIRKDELLPNINLREACEDFISNNPWAVDW